MSVEECCVHDFNFNKKCSYIFDKLYGCHGLVKNIFKKKERHG